VCDDGPDEHLAAVAPCWCTRLIVESTDSRQSISPGGLGLGLQRRQHPVQVPSCDQRWCRR
jgi:hypothetical protein